MQNTIKEGDTVLCKRGSIDKNAGSGLVGTVTGFARFSPSHPREAFVRFGDVSDYHPDSGWFWVSDLLKNK